MITGFSLMGLVAAQGNVLATISFIIAGAFALSSFARRASKSEAKAE